MNVRPPIEASNPTAVLSVSFNSDSSCFAVGLESGICIFHTKSCLLKASRDFNAGIGHVQMMGTTNYLALVGGGRFPKFTSNKVVIWDDMKGKAALEISANSSVRGVQLSREYIIVLLRHKVSVYKFHNSLKLLHEYETSDNSLGLCTLSSKHLACPGRTAGQIQLIELATGNVSIIPAHETALQAIQLSPDGKLLASASEKGTLIRVYLTSSCAKVAELRRGIDRATIFSLGFSPSGAMLACTSDKSTLHIFDIPNVRRQSVAQRGQQHHGIGDVEPGKWGILSQLPLMPRLFSDVYSFTSAPFQAADEGIIGGIPYSDGATALGTPRPAKGIIGWISEDSLAIVGAGKDARWERFVLVTDESGRRVCVKEGWKRYLGNT